MSDAPLPAESPPATRPLRVAVFEGCFSPPTLTHVEAVQALSERFDRVVVVPCGTRREWAQLSPAAAQVPLLHRAAMVDIAFGGHVSPRCTVDLTDLERAEWSSTADLIASSGRADGAAACPPLYLRRHGGRAAQLSDECEKMEREVWLAIGMEAVASIRTEWTDGDALWARARFAIFERPDMETPPADRLPPTHALLPPLRHQVSTEAVRERIFANRDISAHVPHMVAEYIASFMLFRGAPPPTTMAFCLPRLRALLVWDRQNPLACSVAERLRPVEDAADPNVVLVVGGDGTMLRAIREYWRMRLPFFGINTGHLGFMLNELPASMSRLLDPGFTFCGEVLLHHLPLLLVECTDPAGNAMPSALAFNDAWVERASGQSTWLQLRVNGEIKLPRLVSDGLLVCTAAGSTAYAQSMGCCPVPVGTPLMCVVGNNVSMPLAWRPVYLPLVDCCVEFQGIDIEKRPMRAFVDGVELGPVSSMRVRQSNVADCRLVFLKMETMLRKLSKLQFPSAHAAPTTILADAPFVPMPVTPAPTPPPPHQSLQQHHQ